MKSFILITFTLFTGCINTPNGKPIPKNDSIQLGYVLELNHQSDLIDTVLLTKLYNDVIPISYSCDTLIEGMIAGGDIEIGIKGFPFKVIQANKDSVLAKYWETQPDGTEYIISLILILPQKQEVWDISDGLQKPIMLSFDKSLMKFIKSNCLLSKQNQN